MPTMTDIAIALFFVAFFVALIACLLGICLTPLLVPSDPDARRSMGIRLPEDNQ